MDLTSPMAQSSAGELLDRGCDVRELAHQARRGWRLIREIGVEYNSSPPEARVLDLCFPLAAQRTHEGSWLIVDEPEGESAVPVRLQGRTMLVSCDGKVTFDTRRCGIPDAIGCIAEQGKIALLRRTRWDILIVTQDGVLDKRIDLSSVSKLTPRIMCWTGHSFLIVFLTKSHLLDLVEVDPAGRLLWCLPQAGERLGVPGSVQLLPRNTILVADAYRHVVQEIRRDGSAELRWGQWAHPSRSLQHLSSPSCARELPDNRLYIADTNNHRVLLVDSSGRAEEWPREGAQWVTPTWVDVYNEGGVLVCDGGGKTVTDHYVDGRVRWQTGQVTRTTRLLSFPRSAQYLGQSRYLIADTAANRLLEAGPEGISERAVHHDVPLFWPRSACQTEDGLVAVADGRRSRILLVDRDGRVQCTLSRLRDGTDTFSLIDPHDVRVTSKGKVLVVDSALNLVFESDWSGNVTWKFGIDGETRLADPHSAQMLRDGRIVISDPGNHRVLLVDRNDQSVRAITTLRGENELRRLNQPRYAEVAADDTLVIVDTGNNRVLASDLTGRMRWELSAVPDSPVPLLLHPRWAHLINSNEILVADHFHHRILHLVRT